MTVRFTKELRQKIIRDFCLKRNADFDARLFEREVRETGEAHPAYSWFQWDEDKAAEQYRIWQAREFANGLTVSFTVEEIGRNKSISVREVEMPMLLSPLGGRRAGGGYLLSDPANPDHMAELCKQAATDLSRWLRRYEGAVAYAGGSVAAMERHLKLLEAKSLQEMKEVA